MQAPAVSTPQEATQSAKLLLLAAPRGFCAGVDRAVSTVELALQIAGPPVYVRKHIVHNRHVVNRLAACGAVFVEELSQVPRGSVVVFSAHGVAPEVRRAAAELGLRVIDATCPLVTKVHQEAHAYAKRGLTVLLIGHAGHDEVVGVLGELPGLITLIASVEDASSVQVPDPDRVGVLMQTTLSLDDSRKILAALRRRFPSLVLPPVNDICYATQNRQRAVRAIAARSELVIVLGSSGSSNALRLCEVAESCGAAARLADQIEAVEPELLDRIQCVGLTAGASTPEWIVQQAIGHLAARGFRNVEEVVIAEETVSFAPARYPDSSFIPLRALRGSLQ
jgi:4-hydroxy-3-methylbut-2-en-1-yl diphosphate reductase